MIVELVAGRVISRFVGQSLYTWTSVIGVVLAGISVGNYIGGVLADRYKPAPTISLLFMFSAALCMCIPALNAWAGGRLFLLERDWPVRIFLHVFFTFFLPSCALGMISPVVARMAVTQSAKTGRAIGDVYAWGAAGSILGTFLAGYYLIAALGTFAVIAVVSSVLALMGLLYAARSWAARFFFCANAGGRGRSGD